MMLFHLLQAIPDLIVTLPDGATWMESFQHAIHISPADWSLVAQQFETDVFADFRSFFNNFIESGQVWALIVGVIIGYLLRGLTSYG
ncbi:MAG: hypothetical protein VKL39_19870 [Leptolyngbyaceae bacterium]|nr:hypothetical protein [Leptolyngbyaceae bacterium]